ncbi:MAG: T9SS type A sorting domain-containing protein [Bacteroidia bacterium]|nr:T9SS type A sorting domain-containing protein [Bacteroidia bacterium]
MKKITVLYGTIAAVCMLLSCPSFSQAQCFSAPVAGVCSGGNGTLGNNANVNGGQTYIYGGSGSVSNVNLNGGTIRVCGTLTIYSLNFNSGRILVESGGSLTLMNGFNMNGNSIIVNRGLLDIRGSITMQNSSNYVLNLGASAVLQMNNTGTRLELNSSSAYFSNEGVANIYELRIQSQAAAGSVCLGKSSCTQTQYINNNRAGAVTANSQKAAISVGQNIYLNQPLTSDTALVICQRSGSSKGGPAAYGTPKIYTDCPSCSVALPVSLTSFEAGYQDRDVVLTWSTASESNNAYFTIERSSDNSNWEEIGTVSGQGNSNEVVEYSYTDAAVPAGTWYYRLRQTDYNGQSEVFAPLSVLVQSASDAKFSVYPVPFSTQLTIQFSGEEDSHLVEILNGVGQVISSTRITGNMAQLSTENLQPGFYFVRSGAETLKVIKKG